MAALLAWGQDSRIKRLEKTKRIFIQLAGWLPLLYLLLFGTVRSRLNLEDSLPFVIGNAVALLIIAGALIATEQTRENATQVA
jgi:hypothetical protein